MIKFLLLAILFWLAASFKDFAAFCRRAACQTMALDLGGESTIELNQPRHFSHGPQLLEYWRWEINARS